MARIRMGLISQCTLAYRSPMTRRRRGLLALALAPWCARAQAADTWLRLDTPHFEMAGNVGEGELKRVAHKFELFRGVLEQILERVPPGGSTPRVFVFKDRGSYRPYLPVVDGKPVELGGYFHGGHSRPYITLAVSPWAEDPYHVVFHEYVHLLTSKSPAPSWFREGFAEFLAGSVIDGERAEVGRPDRSHVWTLRTNTPLPLASLLTIPVPAHDRWQQRLYYAQSWLLVHYLMTERPQGRQQMVAFLNGSPAAKELEPAFRQAFGVGFAEMEKELGRYVEGRTMSFYKVPIAKTAVPRDLKARRAAPGEAEAMLADLVAQLPGREAEGRARLEKVLQPEPAQAVAKEAQAVAQEALAALARPPVAFVLVHGVKDAVENAQAEELAALSVRVAETMARDEAPDPAVAAELETAVRAFTERSPRNAEGFLVLAGLRRRLGAEPGEIIAILEKAVVADPAAVQPRLQLSQRYRARQDFEAARRVLAEGAALAMDPTLAAFFTTELEALKAMHQVRGFLVDLRCDPGGRLDFVVEEEGGRRRLTLRAEGPLAFTVLRNGQSVQEHLACGKQRRKMGVTYKDLEAPVAAVHGTLFSLSLEEP
jgi:hypothetical protein